MEEGFRGGWRWFMEGGHYSSIVW